MTPLTDTERQMVEDNLKLVAWVINRQFSKHRTEPWEDMHQDGVIGLCKAVRKFDPERGVKFSYFAKDWIANDVRRGIELRRGSGWRAAKRAGRELPSRPLSLDVPRRIDDCPGEGDAITVASPADVEGEAVASVTMLELRHAGMAAAETASDLMMVELITGATELRQAQAAQIVGINVQRYRRRRRQIVAAMREALAS